MYLPVLRIHFKERSEEDLSNDAYAMFFYVFFFSSDFLYNSIYCWYSFELPQLVLL